MLTLFSTKIKCLYRDRQGLFWALLFPIFLAIIYHYAFADLGKTDVLKTIDIAAISTGSGNEATLKQTLQDATFENGLPIFNVAFVEKAEAEQLLDNNKVTGYIVMGEVPELVVKGSDIKATIAKNVLNSYRQMYGVADIITKEAQGESVNYDAVMKDMIDREYYLKNRKEASGTNMDYTVIYFYALLAMVCIYGGNWGLREGADISAALSARGARVNIAPYSMAKLLFCNLSASLALHFTGVLLVIAFMSNILKIDFGTQLLYVIFVCFVGSIVGILFGCLTALLMKGTEKKKDAFLTCITLIWGFLAGLMIPSVKYIVASKFPALTFVNPVHLITDCLYSLYYYSGLSKYTYNIIVLSMIAVLLSCMIVMYMRRGKHGSF